MSVSLYQPWALLEDLTRDLDRLFHRPAGAANDEAAARPWVPAVDVLGDQEGYVVLVDVPGVDPKDIEVHTEKGVLSISGERGAGTLEARDGFKRMERRSGRFTRRFRLPEDADAAAIAARCRNGVLEVHIPKRQPRKIAVGE